MACFTSKEQAEFFSAEKARVQRTYDEISEYLCARRKQAHALFTSYSTGIPQLEDKDAQRHNIQRMQIYTRMHDLDATTAFQTSQACLHSAEVMYTIASIFDAFWHAGGISPIRRLITYIDRLELIGKGAYSFALRARFKNADEFCVLKVTQKERLDDMSLHEGIIGLYGTNHLREDIPNFAYIYGIFRGGPPVFTSRILDWGGYGEERTYVLYENISPAISFSEFTTQATAEEFMQYYLQVMLALEYAYTRIRFTHYDLRLQNVLLREAAEVPFYLSYIDVYIRSNRYIATIIDYGMAYCEIEGHAYGNFTSPLYHAGVRDDRPFPLYDAYKLLCYGLIRLPPSVQEELRDLLYFFNPSEDASTILREQNDYYYAMPWKEEWNTVTLRDWITYCRKYLADHKIPDPIVDTLPEDAYILTPHGECGLDARLAQFGIDVKRESLPASIHEVYDWYKEGSIPPSLHAHISTLVNSACKDWKIDFPLLLHIPLISARDLFVKKRGKDTIMQYFSLVIHFLRTLEQLHDIENVLTSLGTIIPQAKTQVRYITLLIKGKYVQMRELRDNINSCLYAIQTMSLTGLTPQENVVAARVQKEYKISFAYLLKQEEYFRKIITQSKKGALTP